MLMNLQKRAMLIRLMPKTGSLDGQLRCKELSDRLRDLSDEYKAQIEFVDMGEGKFNFNIEKDTLSEFELSESELHVLKRGVEALDKDENITLELVDLCKEIREM
jgi:hypothetical protein